MLIEDKLSFFKKDAAVNSLLAHFRPSIVALTGTCTPGDNAHVKPGDTVVVTNESTPWHGELEHMSEIWRLQDEMQQSVRFQTAHYYSTAKMPVASPEAVLFHVKMKKCKAKGIVHFAAMGVSASGERMKPCVFVGWASDSMLNSFAGPRTSG